MWQRGLILAHVLRLGRHAARQADAEWEDYWGTVRATGTGGDVLWDPGGDAEAKRCLADMEDLMDPGLPVVDVGCGNGQFTRALAGHFPAALGVDISSSAVARARHEAAGLPGVSFRVLDMAEPGAGALLAAELGAANVFVRGVLHILDRSSRVALVQNLHDLLDGVGRLFLVETNFPGSRLAYLEFLGATRRGLPHALRHIIVSGIPSPEAFGHAQLLACFAPQDWEVLRAGVASIDVIAPAGAGAAAGVPGYFAVVAPTSQQVRHLPPG